MKMPNKLIHELIEFYTQSTPSHPVFIMGKQQLTYKQFFTYAKNLAHHLQDFGLYNERIAIHLPNCIELAIVYLGCFMAGAIAVPLNVALKKPEIEYILEKTTPKLFMTHHIQNEELSDIDFSRASIKHLFAIHNPCNEDHLLPFSQLLEPVHNSTLKLPKENDPLAIFFTSGSTGKPKGVMHSHSSLVAMIETMVDASELTAKDRFLVTEPMSNASGCVHTFLAPSIGGTSLLMSSFNVSEFLETIQYRPTRISIMGKANYDIVHEPLLNSTHFKDIKFNLSGGDKITENLIEEFKKKTGIPIRLGYGMSEFLILTVNKSHSKEKLTSVGQAAKNVTIRLLDQQGAVVAPGNSGEIWVRGSNCMLGYWQDPKATEEILVNGWLRTGDLAKQDREGFYWFMGRLKQIIVRDGENISPLEIEEVLSQHPAVHVAAVIGIPDPAEGAVPKAFVELNPGYNVSEALLIDFVKKRLESHKVPVAIKVMDQLPRTKNGKISRKDLH